ncbi:MAG: hypothetical protein K2O66_00590 [Bacteroidales bacterium]|nr:hypothetical protein [Bacteroidales bacterium]
MRAMELYYRLDLWEWILLGGLFLTAAGLVRFYFNVYARLLKYTVPVPGEEKKPVSVVISGKNQYEMLKKNLTFWLEQKYPCFEVIVVYENTDEDIASLLQEFARRYDKLKLINANQSINFFDEKKFSLSVGVKSAENEYVILTDPRFRPTSEYCIDYMQAAFGPKTNIVIGHPVNSARKTRICSFSGWRNAENSLQYIGFALKGKAFTGRRTLIAYRKSFFLEHQGYTDTYALNTGVFDRLCPHLSQKEDLALQLAPQAEVRFTDPHGHTGTYRSEKQYLNTLYSQKSSARTEIRLYRWLTPLFFLFLAGNILYFASGMNQGRYPLLPVWIIAAGAVALFKFVIQAVVMQKAGNVIRSGLLWLCLPLYEILYLPLQVALCWGKKRGRA